MIEVDSFLCFVLLMKHGIACRLPIKVTKRLYTFCNMILWLVISVHIAKLWDENQH